MPNQMARALVVLVLITAPLSLSAQRWVRGAELPLVQRASDLRHAQATDTALASWRATAHGILRLAPAAQPGTVVSPVPSKVDELTVTVYGRLPDRVKQVITNWRDSVLQPMTVPRYHRDHLGIVSSDFGDRIRLGDGDEVRDVLHPLSTAGLAYYEFALGDTLRIGGDGVDIRVVAISVRPRDPTSPGTVGTLFIDPERRTLVRFRFTFTPESYRDPTVRDITVTLESGLLDLTHWLPWRQSIVIERIDRSYGMIRADWEIRDYVLGDRSADSLFRQGRDSFPAVGGLRAQRGSLSGDTAVKSVLEKLPKPDEGVRATAKEASEMVGRRSLHGGRRGIRVSRELLQTFFRVNRVQGYTVYPGVAIPVGQTLTATLRAGYGFSDRRMFGLARLDGPLGRAAWQLEGERAMQDVGDVRQHDGLFGWLYPFTRGRDPGDWTLISRATLGLRVPLGQIQFTLDGGVERSESVITRHPLRNDDRDNPALGAGTARVARLSVGRRWSNDNEISTRMEIGRGDADWQRVAGRITLHQSLGAGRAILSLSGGAGSRRLPAYRDFVLGGSSTLPGVARRSLGGRSMQLADLSYERRFAMPSLFGPRRPPGRSARAHTVAPFIAVGRAGGDEPLLPWRGENVAVTVAGLRFNIGGLFRFSVGARVP